MEHGDGARSRLTVPVVRTIGTVAAMGTFVALILASLELSLLSGNRGLLAAMLLGNATAGLACLLALVLLIRVPGRVAARAVSVVLVSTALLYLLVVVPLALAGRGAGAFVAGQDSAVAWFWAAVSLLLALAGLGIVRFAAFFPHPVTEEMLAVARDLGEDAVDEVPALLSVPARITWWLRHLSRKLPRALQLTDDPAGASFWFMQRTLRVIRSPGYWLAAPALVLTVVVWRWNLLLLSVLIALIFFPLAAELIGTSYVASGRRERRKILWLTAGIFPCAILLCAGLGMSTAIVESVLTGGLQSSRNVTKLLVLVSPAGLILMGGLAAAIFLHGALDPALAIRRTALYGSLGVGLAFLFAVLENALSDLMLSGLGLPSGAGAWMAGGFLALVVVPLHRWTRRGVDRLLEERIPDTTDPLLPESDAVLLGAEPLDARPTAPPGDHAGETLPAVLVAAARKAANGRDDKAAARADEPGVIVTVERPDGVLGAAIGLRRNVRAAAEALDLPAVDLRLAIHRGRVTLSEHGVAGPDAEVLREARAGGAPGSILVTEAVFRGRPPDDELEGLRVEETDSLEGPIANGPLRLWRVFEPEEA